MPKIPAPTKRSVDELKALQKQLRRYSRMPEWHDRIKEELRGPVREAETKVKAKILAIPSKTRDRGSRGGKRGSLRRKMVQAVRTNVDTTKDYTGGFVWLDAYSMPADEQNLPAYMERVKRYTRWRHTVFGDESKWVTQKAHPYFYRTLKQYETVTADVAEKVISAAERDIGRG